MNPKPPLIVGKNYGEGILFAFLFSNSVEEITEDKYMVLLSEAVPSSYISDVVNWYAPIVAKKGYWHALSKIYVSSPLPFFRNLNNAKRGTYLFIRERR